MAGYGVFSGSSAWADKRKERKETSAARRSKRKETSTARRSKRKETRATRKKHSKEQRQKVKEIRKGEGTSKEKRVKIGATRAYHKVDKYGKAGGMTGMFKYSKKIGDRAARKKAVAEKIAAGIARCFAAA